MWPLTSTLPELNTEQVDICDAMKRKFDEAKHRSLHELDRITVEIDGLNDLTKKLREALK